MLGIKPSTPGACCMLGIKPSTPGACPMRICSSCTPCQHENPLSLVPTKKHTICANNRRRVCISGIFPRALAAREHNICLLQVGDSHQTDIPHLEQLYSDKSRGHEQGAHRNAGHTCACCMFGIKPSTPGACPMRICSSCTPCAKITRQVACQRPIPTLRLIYVRVLHVGLNRRSLHLNIVH